MSELSKRVLLVCSSVVIFFVLAECMVRLIEPKEIMRYFFLTSDDILDHKFIPNGRGFFETMEFRTEYVINSLGLRDREFPLQKPPTIKWY